MAWQSVSPEVTVKGFKMCCISSAVDGTDDVLWNGSTDNGNVRSECKEDEALNCEDGDSDWLVKVDRIWHALSIQCMKLKATYFFLKDSFFGRVRFG